MIIAGVPLCRLASRFGISHWSLRHHKSAHLPTLLAKAHDAAEAANADNLLSQIREYEARALDILAKAEQAGDYRTALGAIHEARACLEFLAGLTLELGQRPAVNILLTPQWLELRAIIIETLTPFPEACAALYERLSKTDASNSHLPTGGSGS